MKSQQSPRQQEEERAGPDHEVGYPYFEFLTEATEVLASAIDYEAALAVVARLALNRLADYCVVHLVESGGDIRQVAAAHRDPRREKLLHEIDRLHTTDFNRPVSLVTKVIGSGEPVFGSNAGEKFMEMAKGHVALRRLYDQLGPRSYMVVPLIARGRTLGTMTFVAAESGRHYRREDLVLALEIARYAGLAVDNARLYREAQREIAERRQAEEALRASEARLRGIIDSNTIGILFSDSDGRITEANDAFLRTMRFTRESIRSGAVCWHRMTPADDRRRHDNAVAEMLAGGACMPYEQELITGDGTVLPALVVRARLEGESGESVGFVIDLTERKRAKSELERSLEIITATFEEMPDAFILLDEEGRLRHANRAASRLFGQREHVLIERDGWSLLSEALGPCFASRCQETASRRASMECVELFETLGRWLEARLFPTSANQFAISLRDVTDRRRAEEELIAAKEQAETASRAKDRFLAVLSHELRTPLTPVLAMIQALQSEENVSDDVRASIEIINRNVELEARLIDDLLDLTRIVKGKVPLHIEPVEMHTLIGQVLESCREDLRSKRLSLVADLTAVRHLVPGDSTRLQQILWNLMKNAIKFTHDNGTIILRTENDDEGRLCIEIRDSGIGIDPEMLPHIFDAFEQGESTITRRYGGLGLGLAIARALVELHDGVILAESTGRDKGALFRINLPTQEGVAVQESVEPVYTQRERNTTSQPRILLVEDHGDTSTVLKKLLERKGFTVHVASDVQSALDAVHGETFDLLVSDIGLPDGTGLDLLTQLRSEGNNIPGIALSGFGMEEDIARSLAAGFTEHLTKPVSVQHLAEAIRGIINSEF